MVVGPYKSYSYYKWDSGFTSSTTMGANTAANMHLPFNPIIGDFNPPKVEYGEEELTFFSDEDTSMAWSTQAEPEETENEAVFRSPIFMMNALFTHNSMSAAWASSGSTNVMASNFTSQSHVSSLVVQDHVHDQSDGGNDIDRVYYGIKVVDYAWVGEKGKKLHENWKWKARGYQNTAQACDMDAGFDDSAFDRTGVDGGFDQWDGSVPTGLLWTDVTLTVAGAALSHVNVEKWKLGCRRPVEFLYDITSKDAFDAFKKPRKYYLEVDGTVAGPNQYTEIKNTIASRTRKTIKATYQTNKYLQFTNAVLKKIDAPKIPRAGEPLKVSLLFEGVPGTSGTLPTMSFAWQGPEATDPTNAVHHT